MGGSLYRAPESSAGIAPRPFFLLGPSPLPPPIALTRRLEPPPRLDLPRIVRRHLRTLPSSSNHDLRQRRTSGCQILSSTDPR